MTEAEWLTSDDPFALFAHLGDSTGWRKRQLFCLACWNLVRHPIEEEYARRGLALFEEYVEREDWRCPEGENHERLEDAYTDVDGELVGRFWSDPAGRTAREEDLWDEVEAGREADLTVWDNPASVEAGATFTVVAEVLHSGWVLNLYGMEYELTASELAKRIEANARAAGAYPSGIWFLCQSRHADLVREIFGNPFRPAVIEPAWLAWGDGIAGQLAQGIYEDRAFDRLPILADALIDAGCRDDALLDHLRSSGPHVRGCWALDLVLGKE
jgi:hypothetical protein